MADNGRERSGCELVFGLLKVLMAAYRLWGVRSAVAQSELPSFLRTNESRLRGALTYLANEGLVCIDEPEGTVRLSAVGVCDLLSDAGN